MKFDARLLVVDDEADICEFLVDYFTKKGYEVESATDGQDAIEKTKLFRPHIMLLDIKMPGLDGIEVLKKIREFDQTVGVIIVTGVQDVEIGRIALKYGAVDFITKPINLDYLCSSVIAKYMSLLQQG